jgi:hypothetical protein
MPLGTFAESSFQRGANAGMYLILLLGSVGSPTLLLFILLSEECGRLLARAAGIQTVESESAFLRVTYHTIRMT